MSRDHISKYVKRIRKTPVPSEVAANITGLMFIRNHAAHLGTLLEPVVKVCLSSSAIRDRWLYTYFLKLSRQWFGETIVAPYLLPLGALSEIGVTYPPDLGLAWRKDGC